MPHGFDESEWIRLSSLERTWAAKPSTDLTAGASFETRRKELLLVIPEAKRDKSATRRLEKTPDFGRSRTPGTGRATPAAAVGLTHRGKDRSSFATAVGDLEEPGATESQGVAANNMGEQEEGEEAEGTRC